MRIFLSIEPFFGGAAGASAMSRLLMSATSYGRQVFSFQDIPAAFLLK
jgi:hypothetical protein